MQSRRRNQVTSVPPSDSTQPHPTQPSPTPPHPTPLHPTPRYTTPLHTTPPTPPAVSEEGGSTRASLSPYSSVHDGALRHGACAGRVRLVSWLMGLMHAQPALGAWESVSLRHCALQRMQARGVLTNAMQSLEPRRLLCQAVLLYQGMCS